MASVYYGPERRRHRMYVTRNTEYHFRDSVCVGVRDLHTGQWLPSHLAVGRRLTGAVRLMPNGTPIPTDRGPGVGESLYFGDEGRDLITSRLDAVQRPPRNALECYADHEPAHF